MIPEPHYTLINTSIGEDPAVVVINSSLRTFENREEFPWHLRIGIDCKLLAANGMPTEEEGDALHRLEESITTPLQTAQNVLFLARITARSQRVLLFRVHNPEVANEPLQTLAAAPSQLREWDFQMEHDPDWELAQPELHLLEHDPRFN